MELRNGGVGGDDGVEKGRGEEGSSIVGWGRKREIGSIMKRGGERNVTYQDYGNRI